MPFITSDPITLLLWAIVAYLAGSVPFGLVLTKAMGIGNLREIGSGNIGATNVLRTGSKKAAALTLLLDGAKGAVVVLIARAMGAGDDAVQLAALAAMIGHCYPVWLAFKGGKGVATFLGLMLALHWPVGVGCCIAWLVGAALFRISSMGAIVAASSSTFLLVFTGYGNALILGLVLTLLVFFRHRENIVRLRAGTEPKIGQKSS